MSFPQHTATQNGSYFPAPMDAPSFVSSPLLPYQWCRTSHHLLPLSQRSSPAYSCNPPHARISDALPAYRQALLSHRPPVSIVTPPCRSKPQTEQYIVRPARTSELYTVADIRCEAFYGHPKDPYYYPVRRREIYMAMRDRLESGTRCLVVTDKTPPEQWQAFAQDGALVVGSVDISFHKPQSGRRVRSGDGLWLYLSSMAIREDWQGRGLAQRLLKQVDLLADGVGDVVYLHVEEENRRAWHVYEKCGFEVVKEDVPQWLHFLAKREHILMRKRLQ